MKNKHNGGFTLVELLVSIVILAAIVLPTCTSLVLSYRMNAKSEALMQAQLAVSSAVETLMAEGIDATRANAIMENTENGTDIVYDYAWVSVEGEAGPKGQFSEKDDYPGVIITITEGESTQGYFSLSVSDDDGLVTVTTQIRVKGGA